MVEKIEIQDIGFRSKSPKKYFLSPILSDPYSTSTSMSNFNVNKSKQQIGNRRGFKQAAKKKV